MKRIFLCLVVLWVGGVFLTQSPVVHTGIADASQQGSLGGILVGLALLTPAYGLFLILRTYSRAQRLLHHRMQTEGLLRRGKRP